VRQYSIATTALLLRPKRQSGVALATAVQNKPTPPATGQRFEISTRRTEAERIDVCHWFYDAILMRRYVVVTALLLGCFVSQMVSAQEQFPLQADLRVRVDYNDRGLVSFRAVLEGGEATLRGTVQNLLGRETGLVQLHFDYRTDADIALDELISRIVIWTIDRTGNEFSKVVIDPNSVPLNPNRVPLHYAGTVYKPPRNNRTSYVVRIQVFGNYE